MKLDRLARSGLAQELQALGVDLVVLDQAIDTTTLTGRPLFHVLATIAEFEHERPIPPSGSCPRSSVLRSAALRLVTDRAVSHTLAAS